MNKDAFRQTTYSLDVCFIIPYSTENDQTYVFSYMTVNAIYCISCYSKSAIWAATEIRKTTIQSVKNILIYYIL